MDLTRLAHLKQESIHCNQVVNRAISNISPTYSASRGSRDSETGEYRLSTALGGTVRAQGLGASGYPETQVPVAVINNSSGFWYSA